MADQRELEVINNSGELKEIFLGSTEAEDKVARIKDLGIPPANMIWVYDSDLQAKVQLDDVSGINAVLQASGIVVFGQGQFTAWSPSEVCSVIGQGSLITTFRDSIEGGPIIGMDIAGDNSISGVGIANESFTPGVSGLRMTDTNAPFFPSLVKDVLSIAPTGAGFEFINSQIWLLGDNVTIFSPDSINAVNSSVFIQGRLLGEFSGDVDSDLVMIGSLAHFDDVENSDRTKLRGWFYDTDGGLLPELGDFTYAGLTSSIHEFWTATKGGLKEFLAIIGQSLSDLFEGTSTGINVGGQLSAGTTGTYSATDGHGFIHNVLTGVTTKVSWTGKTNIPVTNIGIQDRTYIKVDINGVFLQQFAEPSITDYADYIVLGVLGHQGFVDVTSLNSSVAPARNYSAQFKALARALGLMNVEGNLFSANGANLSLDKSVGSMYNFGGNWINDEVDTDIIEQVATSAPLLIKATQSAITGADAFIDAGNYDLNGVITAMATSKYSIHRLVLFPGGTTFVQYGQAFYNSLAEGLAAVQSEPFIQNETTALGLLRGYLVIKADTTNIATAVAGGTAAFVAANKFGWGS